MKWLFAILERGEAGRPYNVGSAEALSIRALAEKVRTVLGTTNEIKVQGWATGDKTSVYVPVIDRGKYELGLSVVVPLEQAICWTCEAVR